VEYVPAAAPCQRNAPTDQFRRRVLAPDQHVVRGQVDGPLGGAAFGLGQHVRQSRVGSLSLLRQRPKAAIPAPGTEHKGAEVWPFAAQLFDHFALIKKLPNEMPRKALFGSWRWNRTPPSAPWLAHHGHDLRQGFCTDVAVGMSRQSDFDEKSGDIAKRGMKEARKPAISAGHTARRSSQPLISWTPFVIYDPFSRILAGVCRRRAAIPNPRLNQEKIDAEIRISAPQAASSIHQI